MGKWGSIRSQRSLWVLIYDLEILNFPPSVFCDLFDVVFSPGAVTARDLSIASMGSSSLICESLSRFTDRDLRV